MTEDKNPTHDARYFDELLEKLRDIRSSNRRSGQRVADILALTADYDGDNTVNYFAPYVQQLDELSFMERFANMLQMKAEAFAKSRIELEVNDIVGWADDFFCADHRTANTFKSQCYAGDEVCDEEGAIISYLLPEELKTSHIKYIVLKIDNIDYFVDVFSEINNHDKRAYKILAELDKEVILCVDNKKFPNTVFIPYNENADALFGFSHFEMDMSEPEADYRTLYVVYSYFYSVS